jgi:proline dehydrogenase
MIATLRRFAVSPVMPLLRAAARAYVVGPELADALAKARSLASAGAASTICFWDGPEDSPHQVAQRYSDTLRAIARVNLDSYVSIKAPSLAFDGGLVAGIAHEARSLGVGLHFDSLGPEAADRTFELMEDVRRLQTNLGCTLPGRWRRSVADAERAARLGLNVRVVKGQWADADAKGADPRRGYLEVVEALAGRARKVAVATHDPVLASQAISKLQAAGTPCELELLYGLPSRAALAAGRKLGAPVRFYLPYGHAWLPYGVRQAGRNPRILWWMLRDAWSAAK